MRESIPGENSQRETDASIRERLQLELGQEIYRTAEDLRLQALTTLRIDPEAQLGSGRLMVKLIAHNDDDITAVEVEASSMRVGDNSLRLIKLEGVDRKGMPVFKMGRYIEPGGQMWVQADSSQGLPWYEAQLPVEELIQFHEQLVGLQQSSYRIEASMKTFGHHQQPVAILQ